MLNHSTLLYTDIFSLNTAILLCIHYSISFFSIQYTDILSLHSALTAFIVGHASPRSANFASSANSQQLTLNSISGITVALTVFCMYSIFRYFSVD